MKRRGKYCFAALTVTAAVTAALNAAAWRSAAFCDYYVLHIYPFFVSSYGRLTGWAPFSVGTVMIVAGIILTAAVLLSGLATVIFAVARRALPRGSNGSGAACGMFRRVRRVLCGGYVWILDAVFVIMTLNCFIPYHCSPLEKRYPLTGGSPEGSRLAEGLSDHSYTLDELTELRDFVVIKANSLAAQVDRDENGELIYPENMERIAADSMRSLSADCGQLGGYYPDAKELGFSGFFSQQQIKGYFFPFSMEANYNGLMHPINYPATLCHEYAHLKGFMLEDEANMLGFLACINSSDLIFQYSGYLSVLNYVNNEFYDAVGRDGAVYASHVKVSPQVRAENIFLEEEVWEKVEEKAVIKTEIVDKVSDQLSDASMMLNGVQDGILSYTRVVELLMDYYKGSPEVQETLYGPEYLVQLE